MFSFFLLRLNSASFNLPAWLSFYDYVFKARLGRFHAGDALRLVSWNLWTAIWRNVRNHFIRVPCSVKCLRGHHRDPTPMAKISLRMSRNAISIGGLLGIRAAVKSEPEPRRLHRLTVFITPDGNYFYSTQCVRLQFPPFHHQSQ